VLSKYAEHWKIHRMAVVDRNLLRLGLFELMFQKEIPFPIIINEALEIVKEFSDHESTQFLNGILDAARKEFRPEETGPKARHKPASAAPAEEA
jgi:N utilization substance protein B